MLPSSLAPLLIFAAIIVALFSLPVVLGFLAGLWEKRMVWPYIPEVEPGAEPSPARQAEPADPYAAPARAVPLEITEYAIALNRELDGRGLRHLGRFFNGQGKLYKLSYDFWLAPDRMVLVLVGGGTLAGIPLQATWLFTRLLDGRCLVTLDEPKGQDSDPAGLTDQKILANADFAELMALHRRRIAEADPAAIPYSAADPLADHRAFRRSRAALLVEQGWAKFLDLEENWWKYTAKGALLAALRTSAREWKRSIGQGDRQTIRRPGQKGFVPSQRRGSAASPWMERLRFVFWMMVAMSFFLSFRGPARTRAQLLFRILVPLIGFAGLIVLWMVRRAMSRPAQHNEEDWEATSDVPAGWRK
jgi:hypothetical protein